MIFIKKHLVSVFCVFWVFLPVNLFAQEELIPQYNHISEPPFRLIKPFGINNPVLTASDVTDVEAKFVADPFLFRENEMWYMFFEVLIPDASPEGGRGAIGLATSPDGLHWNYERIVLSEDFHLSYPLVFKYDGKYYMIPESYQKKDVRIYEATTFPYEWGPPTEILSGRPFVDPSIFRHNNKWWMFIGDIDANCRLYYSDSLLSGWVEHPKSPIVFNDPAKARPGGRSFVFDNDKIIRIAQNCTDEEGGDRYGRQVRAFMVTALNETEYSEQELAESPLFSDSGRGWNASGMHHYDLQWTGNEWIVVTDGYYGNDIWSIGIYTDLPGENDKIFAPIESVTGVNDNTDESLGLVLNNLIEGPDVGYNETCPYNRISDGSWSTKSVGYPGSYFSIHPEPIVLDFKLDHTYWLNGVGLWANKFNFGNSVKDFTLQFSTTGSVAGLGPEYRFTAEDANPESIEMFSPCSGGANFVRMTILSNNFDPNNPAIGGDRVGLQEVAFLIEPTNPIAVITKVTGTGNDDPAYPLNNLIEGVCSGYESTWPYNRTSEQSWSTISVGSQESYFSIYPEPIVLDFELDKIYRLKGVGLWPNKFNFGNSVKNFTLQFSATGSPAGLAEPVAFTAEDANPESVEYVALPSFVEANFVRMSILSNNFDPNDPAAGGDRVGLQEVTFFGDCECESVVMNLSAGWSMISLPVIPDNTSVSTLFPDAVVVYGFEKGSGYVRKETLEVGKGYWILVNEAQSYTLTGQAIQSHTIPIDADGWLMIGGCTEPAKTSVDSGNVGVIYKFTQEVGYQRVYTSENENLEPGQGYWILLNDVAPEATICVETVD